MFSPCLTEINRHYACAEGPSEDVRKKAAWCILTACFPCVCIECLCIDCWTWRRAKSEARKKDVRDKVNSFARANPDLKKWDDLYRRYLAEGNCGISEGTFSIVYNNEKISKGTIQCGTHRSEIQSNDA